MQPYLDKDTLFDTDLFDPLCIERTAPIDDSEAALIEALCHAATPGPMVVDDHTSGNGAVVATLPDGRMIVSLTASVDQTRADGAMHANAELICKARHHLLRLLRDRRQWKGERAYLCNRLRTLEAALGDDADGPHGTNVGSATPRRPR